MELKRFGIIDIGSNSIRLVIYEQTEHQAHRVVDENKASARLSELIDDNGNLPHSGMLSIIETLQYFQMLCRVNQTQHIRAVATAAVRNAGNSAEIAKTITAQIGMPIEILSGEQEARYGYLGVRNTLDIAEGIIVDIGGGSTEIALFHNKEIVKSVSFPFGSVNTSKRFLKNGNLDTEGMSKITAMVEKAIDAHPWIKEHPGLPLIGLGGTIRSLSKIDQKQKKYSLQLTHNYQMSAQDVSLMLLTLQPLPLEKRKKFPGLSKDRADIIVPGLIILHTVFKLCQAEHYVISGSGLRDGLFYETINPEHPVIDDVLEYSVRNLMALHPAIPLRHVEQVNRLALALFDNLHHYHALTGRVRQFLHVASLLYRIGVTINYYQYAKHTFYLMAHSRIDGLSHREILICSLIASYKTKSRTRALFFEHKDILTESDYHLIVQLGTLLHLAIALDRSETQPVEQISATIFKKELQLKIKCSRSLLIELKEVETIEKEFTKLWGLSLNIIQE